ncbi:MAG: DUF4159 domain-containing protein [Candidatus Eisenbacteria bacterium]|nr:DUF4159 domain-containing protein [Candidatus Eisenbacteria bacterium]
MRSCRARFVWLLAALLLLTAPVTRSGMCGAAESRGFTIAQLKYRGGGDWYANPTSLPNLLAAVRARTDIEVAEAPRTVSLDDDEIFLHPMIHMTGHGRVALSDDEAARLRRYLERGGFLWADDNYGMDRYLREQLDRVLPDAPLIELPFDHEIYHSFYDFPAGLPKIHEHDGGPPHGYGAFLNGRLAVFYSFNTDIGDGLEDAEVHNDPPDKHEAALRMGVNIVVYALTH